MIHAARCSAFASIMLGALFTVNSGSAEAQTEVPPTIKLGVPLPPEVEPAPTVGPPEALADDSPVIKLQPPTGEPFVDSALPIMPLPVERDRALAASPQQLDWLLPLIADPRLSRQVRIGDSLPAPGILRLTGEIASTELTLVLPEMVAPLTEFQITLRSGVDVLISAAVLGISINGGDNIDLPLRSIGDFSQATLPATGLRPGINSIALNVRQPHRIFCGPDASFDVWTEINLAQSGVVLPAGVVRPDAAGFALAMGAQLAQDGSLDLLVEQGIDSSELRQASDAVMASLDRRGRLRVGSYYADAVPRYAAVALIASDRSAVSYRKGASGSIILQVEYRDSELPNLAAALPLALSDNTGPPPVTPGRPASLAELGHSDIIGNTHYFRRNIDFTLPDDWLLLANQKARLTLHYGFARQLAEGAILLVKINEQTVRLLPMDREGGNLQPPLPVAFNASLLHPGRNTLSLEMMVPGDPPSEACPVRTTDMLVVLADSTLEVPPSPSMVLPGMASTMLGLTPTNVTVPPAASTDAPLQATAIRLASALSLPPQPRESVGLTVARLSELNLIPLEVAGISQGNLQVVLLPQRIDAPEAAAVQTPAPLAYTLEAPSQADDVQESPGALSRVWATINGRLFSQKRLLQNAEDFRKTAFQGSELSLRDWLADRKGSALLFRPDPDAPDSLWLVLAPQVSVDDVADRLQMLIAARSAIGEAALLQTDGSWDIWTPIRRPELREPLLGGNLRAILGNYASWSPLLFTLSLLALALLSARPALLYVLASREAKGR